MDISSSFSGNRKATIIIISYPSKHCYNWKIDLVKLRLPFSHHSISGHTLLCPDPIGPYLKTLSRHLPADPLGQTKSHTYLACTTPLDWMEVCLCRSPLLWTIADCKQIKLMQLLSDTSITAISSCSPCQQDDTLGFNITDNEIQVHVQLMWSDWLIKITNFANGLSHKRSANDRLLSQKKLNSRITRGYAGNLGIRYSGSAELHTRAQKKQFTYTIRSRSDKGGKFHWFLFL